MYLLDTVVLSELRKRHRNPKVVEWIGQRVSSELYLSVVTVGEIERGIAQQKRRNPEFSRELSFWLDRVLSLYGDRILQIDTPITRRWGRLSADLGHDGPDLLIAATALEHGLTVVTRNTRHFEPTGVAVINPFQSSAR
jgi:predicted nucleic acid-binding protein